MREREKARARGRERTVHVYMYTYRDTYIRRCACARIKRGSEVGTKDSEDNIEIRFVRFLYGREREKRGREREREPEKRTLCIRIHASNPPFIGDSATLKRSLRIAAYIQARASEVLYTTISSFSRHPTSARGRMETRERWKKATICIYIERSYAHTREKERPFRCARGKRVAGLARPLIVKAPGVFSGGLYDRLARDLGQ